MRSRFRASGAGALPRGRSDSGSVTAEFAAVLPAVVLVLAIALGAMQIAGEQLRLQSAVADAARMIGRGQTGADARVEATAPGARLSEATHDGIVCANARAPTSFGTVLRMTLSATSCALDDRDTGGGSIGGSG